jgi:hypothetical protein
MERIIANKQEHEIDVRPITLLFHRGDINIQCPDRFEINPEITVSTANSLTAQEYGAFLANETFKAHAEKILGFKLPEHADLATSTLGVRHVVGMLMLLGVCFHKKVAPFVRFPETYLHPAQQVELGDLFAKLAAPGGQPPGIDPHPEQINPTDIDF